MKPRAICTRWGTPFHSRMADEIPQQRDPMANLLGDQCGRSPLESLNCGTETAANSVSFDFAATQWPFSALCLSSSTLDCTGSRGTSVSAQSVPTTSEQVEGQPPLPIRIVGTGFGYLPGGKPAFRPCLGHG